MVMTIGIGEVAVDEGCADEGEGDEGGEEIAHEIGPPVWPRECEAGGEGWPGDGQRFLHAGRCGE
jgi:hypothetical protein